MAIILTDATKLVVTTEKTAEELRLENQRLREQHIAARDVDGTRLYVNGKERKIGKKSQYLLDMLTLPDDK